MATPLILLDVDKTMITTDFRLTNPLALPAIQRLIGQGWQVGLNSDRPVEQLRDFYKHWNLNGPLVVEMGNAVYQATAEQPIYLDEELRERFDRLFHEMITIIRTQYSKVTLLIGEIPLMLSMLPRFGTTKPELFILISSQRRLSFGLNVRISTSGTLQVEPRLLKELAEIAVRSFTQIFAEAPWVIIDYQDYGSFILHSPHADKAKGLEILKNYDVYTPIIVIGDSRFDFTADKNVIHCAVGNAEEAFKRECRFVAAGTFSSGVRECLEWIERVIPITK